ncbi:MAG TPA: hypothetical protein VK203_01725 [Nostocaceae cyanobacterium]|nr:hypothetical protein [Nostocaceae cyanobacterium]
MNKIADISRIEERQIYQKSKSHENFDLLYYSNNPTTTESSRNRKKRLPTSAKIPVVQSKYRFIRAFKNTFDILPEKVDKDSHTGRIPVETINELFFSNDNDSILQIKDYFSLNPFKRKECVECVAKYITSESVVLEVLNLATSRNVREGFDAAIMLLAECGNVIITTLEKLQKPNIDDKDILILEEKWEILVKSIACASKIDAQARFDAIKNLIPDTNRRLVKTAIIDALQIIEDDIDTESIKNELQYFLSDSEQDEYVKKYAQEAIEDIY